MLQINSGLAVALGLLLSTTLSAAPSCRTGFEGKAAQVNPNKNPVATGANWWNSAVFYQIFVRSFADSSQGPLACDGIGDLQGIIENLDYLAGLGVRGLWLTPIMESPSYHGYDTTNYYRVNPEFGTNDDVKRLIKEAHRHGIRVLIDLVLNHGSIADPRFTESVNPQSPYRDWFVWSDTPQRGMAGPWGQEIWHFGGKSADKEQQYYGVFWSGMPDWNYRNPKVTEEMHKVARFWLNDIGVDGFRMDAIRYLYENGTELQDQPETHTWLKDFHGKVKTWKAEALTVGEVWATTTIVADYQNDELDLTFQFDLAKAILAGVSDGSASTVQFGLEDSWKSFKNNQFATFLSNHDIERVMAQLQGKLEKAKLAASILLTGPGVPFIYYGEEIGMPGVKPDEQLRTPMPWTGGTYGGFSSVKPWQPLTPGFEQRNVKAQWGTANSLLSHYRRLIQLRNAQPALQTGDLVLIDAGNDAVLAFARVTKTDRVLVLLNLSDKPVTDYRLSPIDTDLTDLSAGKELLSGRKVPAPANGELKDYQPLVQLEPNSTAVIEF